MSSIKRQTFIWLLATALLTTSPLAEAQQPKKVPRIGLLFPGSQSAFAIWTEAFRRGQRKLDYQRLNLRD